MRKTFITSLSLAAVICLLGMFLIWGQGGILSPGQNESQVVTIIPRGASANKIAQLLTKKRLIMHPVYFYLAMLVTGTRGKLKAGEYGIPTRASPAEIAILFASGQTIKHYLTIPEGQTVAQVIETINSLPKLEGSISKVPDEGMLLPNTYMYQLWDKRQDLVDRMHRAMKQELRKAWVNRSDNLPLETKHELLTLASIVEKETGVPKERPEIAGVFVNRLRKGIRLQADPTVVYSLTKGQEKLGRKLTKKDLKINDPYNTYVQGGLPPGPIACPGVAALRAVANPNPTLNLYFVANGKGGHNFARSLTQHNNNVLAWKKNLN